MGALGAAAVTASGRERPAETAPATGADRATGASQHSIDPIFGLPAATPNPCGGDADESCFEEFPRSTRPSHEVEGLIDLPEPVGAAAEHGLSAETTENVNAAVADGEVDDSELDSPNQEVHGIDLTVLEIATALAGTRGFFFDPAGIHVEPGDVLLFSAETPDHAIAAYHERHGRQNRVPDGVGPISSPLVPVGGSWRYRFEEPGVYDCYCPPHQTFGMVMRVVVHEDGPVPEPSIEDTGRPPIAENFFPVVFGGLDPNLPSSAEALASPALAPEQVIDDGQVGWDRVVEAHRTD